MFRLRDFDLLHVIAYRHVLKIHALKIPGVCKVISEKNYYINNLLQSNKTRKPRFKNPRKSLS